MSAQGSGPRAPQSLQDHNPAFAGQSMSGPPGAAVQPVRPIQDPAANHDQYASNKNGTEGGVTDVDSQAQYSFPLLGAISFPWSPSLDSSSQMQQPAPEWRAQNVQESAATAQWMARSSQPAQGNNETPVQRALRLSLGQNRSHSGHNGFVQGPMRSNDELPAHRALRLSNEQFHRTGYAQGQWSTSVNPRMGEILQYAGKAGDVAQSVNGQLAHVAPGYVFPAPTDQVNKAFDKMAGEVSQNGFPLRPTSQNATHKQQSDGVVNVPQQVKRVRLDPSVAPPSPSTHTGYTTAPWPRTHGGSPRQFTGNNEQLLNATSNSNHHVPSVMIPEHPANTSVPPHPEFIQPAAVDHQPPTITLTGPNDQLLTPEMSLRETSRDIRADPSWIAARAARSEAASRSSGQNPEIRQGNPDVGQANRNRSSSSLPDNAEASFHTATAGSHLDSGSALGQETGHMAGNNDDHDMFDIDKYNNDQEAGQLDHSQPTVGDEFQFHPLLDEHLPGGRGDRSFTNVKAALERDNGKEVKHTHERPGADAEAEATGPEKVPQVGNNEADNFSDFDHILFQDFLQHGHENDLSTDPNIQAGSQFDPPVPPDALDSPSRSASAAFLANNAVDSRAPTEQDRRNDNSVPEGFAAAQPTPPVANSSGWANGLTPADWIGTGDYDDNDPEAFAYEMERKNVTEAAGYNEQRERNQWGLPHEYAFPTVPVTATAVAKIDPGFLDGTDPRTIDWARYENGRDKQKHLQLITLCNNYISHVLRVSLPALRSKAKSAIESIIEIFVRIQPAIDKVMFTSLCLEGEVFPEWQNLMGEKSDELTQEGGEVSFCQPFDTDALDAGKWPGELSPWKQDLRKWISEWDFENKKWRNEPPIEFQEKFNNLWKNLDSLLELVYNRREVAKELIAEFQATQLEEIAKPGDNRLWHRRCYLMWVYLHDGLNHGNPFNYICINDTVGDLKTIMGYEIAAWRELLKDITAIEKRITAEKDHLGKVPHLKRIGFQTEQRQALLAQKDEFARRPGLVERTPPVSPTQNQLPAVVKDAEEFVSNRQSQDNPVEQMTGGGPGTNSDEPFDPVTLDEHRAQQGTPANQAAQSGGLPPWKLQGQHKSDTEYQAKVVAMTKKLLSSQVEEAIRQGRHVQKGTAEWGMLVNAAKEQADEEYVSALAMKLFEHQKATQSNPTGMDEQALKKKAASGANRMFLLQRQRIQRLNHEKAKFIAQHGEQAWNWQQERRVYERLCSEINDNATTPSRQSASGDNAAAAMGHGTQSERRRASQIEDNRELCAFFNRRLAQVRQEWLNGNPEVVPGQEVQNMLHKRATILARRDVQKSKLIQDTSSLYKQNAANKGKPLTRELQRDINRRTDLEVEILEMGWQYEDQFSREVKAWCQTNNLDSNSRPAQCKALYIKSKYEFLFDCKRTARRRLYDLMCAAEKRGELMTEPLKQSYREEAALLEKELQDLYYSKIAPAVHDKKSQYRLTHPDLSGEQLEFAYATITRTTSRRVLELYKQQKTLRSDPESIISGITRSSQRDASQAMNTQTDAHDSDHRSPNVISQAQFPSFDGSSSPRPRSIGLDGKASQPAAPRQRKKSTTASRKNSKDSSEMAPPPIPKKAATATKERGKAKNQSSPTAGKRLPTQTHEPTHINLVTPSPEPEGPAPQQTPQISAGATRSITARKVPMEMPPQGFPGSQQIPTLGQAASRQYTVPQAGVNYAPPEYYTSTPSASRSIAVPSFVAPQAPMMPMMTGAFDENPGHVPRQNGENNSLQSYQAALRKEVNSQSNVTPEQQGRAQNATSMSSPKARIPSTQQSPPRQGRLQSVAQASPSQADANVFRPSANVFTMAQRLPGSPQQGRGQPGSPQRTQGQAQSPPRSQGLASSPGRVAGHLNSPRQTLTQHGSPRQHQALRDSPRQTQAQASSSPRSMSTANGSQAQSMLPPRSQLMTPNGTHASAATREIAEAINARFQAPVVNNQAGQARSQSALQSSPAMTAGGQHVSDASKAFANAINERPSVVLPAQVPQKTKPGLTPPHEQTPATAPTVSQTWSQPSLRPSAQLDPSAQSSQASTSPFTQPAVPGHDHPSQGLKRKAADQPMGQQQAARRSKHVQQSWATLMARQKHAHTIPDFVWNQAQVYGSRNPTPSPNQSFTKPVNDEVMIPDQGALPAMKAFDNAMDPANNLGFPPSPQGTRFDGAHGIAHDKVGARIGEPYFGEEHNYGKVMEHKKMDEMRDIEKRAFNSRTYEWLQQEQQRRKSSTLGYGYAFVGSQDLPGEVLVRIPRMPTVGARESGSNVMEID